MAWAGANKYTSIENFPESITVTEAMTKGHLRGLFWM